VCTHQQNLMNCSIYKNNKTGYRGVTPYKGKYRAMIGMNGRTIYLGDHSCLEDAVVAYNTSSTKLHGEYGCINIIKEVKNGTFII
jgi:hypothetical protein